MDSSGSVNGRRSLDEIIAEFRSDPETWRRKGEEGPILVWDQGQSDSPSGGSLPYSGSQDPEGLEWLWISGVNQDELEWIWPGRLAKGMITVLDGSGGVGKSQVILDEMARITRGWPWPDYLVHDPGKHPVAPLGSVLLVQEEDPVSSVVAPRLELLGADRDRIALAKGAWNHQTGVRRQLELPRDTQYLVDACKSEGHLGVYIDPIFDFIPGNHNMNSDQEMRQALRPLRDGAYEVGFFVNLTRHVRKARAGSAADNGLGTVGITNLSRLNMLVGRHPDDQDLFVIAPSKQNFTARPKALTYRIVEFEQERRPEQLHHTHVEWAGLSDLTAEELIEHWTPEERTLAREIAQMIAEMVNDGIDDYRELQQIAQDRGVSERTWKRAVKATGMCSQYDRIERRWRIGKK